MIDNLPHSYDAECSVLGSILLDPIVAESYDLIPSDFHNDEHRLIASFFTHLIDIGKPVDIILITEEHGKDLHKIGGVEKLWKLRDSVPSTTNFRHYQDIVRTTSKIRKAMVLMNSRAERGIDADDPSKYITEAIEALGGLLDNSREEKQFMRVGEVLNDHEEVINQRRERKGLTGSKTVSTALDELTGGWQKEDLIIIAGRPSMGKTDFMLNDAERGQAQAAKYEIPGSAAAIFSIEMSPKLLAERMLCNVGDLDNRVIKSGELTGTDWTNWGKARVVLNDYPVLIKDSVGITLQQIDRNVKELVKVYPNLTVYIDFLQLVDPGKKFGRGDEGIMHVSKGLKAIARKYKVPVVALSAVGRDCEKRQDKRPMMSDLRESGSIESDADVIIFLYRDSYYNPNTEKKNIIEIIIAKGRNVGTGLIEMLYISSKNKLLDIKKKDEPKQEGEPDADPF